MNKQSSKSSQETKTSANLPEQRDSNEKDQVDLNKFSNKQKSIKAKERDTDLEIKSKFLEKEQMENTGDIEELINDICKEKNIQSKIVIHKNSEGFNIIDLYKVNKKSDITTSEILLSILEVMVNWKRYGFHKYNRDIWGKVINLKLGNKIFAGYDLNTLKKFASLFKSVKDKKAVVELVNKHRDIINNEKNK